MAKINVLPKNIAELIAAGEVVERPASVVKELVENAIDAGASAIVIEIKNGGISYLRVSDDGCGIARGDIKTAFLRHATSKISTADDLNSIFTLGFRGEALASICAVSRVTVLTRTADELAGTTINAFGGELSEPEDAGCPVGTTIIVKDLFYNTPARMKFLKKDVSEGNAVAGCIDRIALSHPEISFKFIRDGKQCLHTAGDSKTLTCAGSVFGREFASNLIPAEYEKNGIKISGYISKPQAARATRAMQLFFLNGRFVKTRTAAAALDEGFKGSIMVGKFPCCILHINVPAETVDVNVHPAKTEVRFSNEKIIFDAVYFAVKNSLFKEDTAPRIEIKDNKVKSEIAFGIPQKAEQKTIDDFIPSKQPATKQHTFVHMTASEFSQSAGSMFADSHKVQYNVAKSEYIPAEKPEAAAKPQYPQAPVKTENTPALTAETEKLPVNDIEIVEKIDPPANQNNFTPAEQPQLQKAMPVNILGEVFGTYILCERDDSLIVIDKHAAHERLIYERLKRSVSESDRQLLLVPVTVSMEKQEYSAIVENLAELNSGGFLIEDFGGGTVVVREFPMVLEKADISEVVSELAQKIIYNKRSLTPKILDELLHSVACRTAVKAHDKLSISEIESLICQLEQNSELKHCPHGRPITVVLEKKELEKRFGRV